MIKNLSEPQSSPYFEALDKLGFCTFPLFYNNEVEQLLSLYHNNFSEKKIDALYATHNSNPVEQSLSISAEIKKIIFEPFHKIFPEYEFFLGHFMVKGAHVEKEFPLHQDWNIVDESKFKSYQVWIPLQISYPANGGIFVIPGSHKFFQNYRSGSYGIPVVPFDETVKPLVNDLIVPAGNVLVYHNGLFHASHPNTTDEIRIAVIANFVEKRAPTYYFHKNNAIGATELYKITGESLIANLPQLEKGIVDKSFTEKLNIGNSETVNSQITSSDLEARYKDKFGQTPAQQVKQLHITNSSGLEEVLNEDGYTVINFLEKEQVEFFQNEYQSLFGTLDKKPGRFTTLQDTDSVMKKRVHDFIVQHVDTPLRNHFRDFIIPVSQFYTKKAHTSGDIDLHGDTTLLINHQLEPHYAIWVPLVDVDDFNGTLTVIPRSHRVRGSFFSGTFICYHETHLAWLRQFELPIKLKAGQAVVFDNNILHNSTANKTDADRLCFTFRITHRNSQYYSFYGLGKNTNDFSIYKEKQDFYMDPNWNGENKSLTATYAGTLKNSVTRVTQEELLKNFQPTISAK